MCLWLSLRRGSYRRPWRARAETRTGREAGDREEVNLIMKPYEAPFLLDLEEVSALEASCCDTGGGSCPQPVEQDA